MENNTQTQKKEYIDVSFVAALMKTKNIDEKTMASSMNVTLQTVKRFLKGIDQKGMSSAMAFKITKALDVPIMFFSIRIINKNYLNSY